MTARIPADTQVPHAGNPAGDMNDVADTLGVLAQFLAGLGGPAGQVPGTAGNIANLAAIQAWPTGVPSLVGALYPDAGGDDTAAIAARLALGGGPVLLGPGTFHASLSPASFQRLIGCGPGVTTLSNTPGDPLFQLDTAAGKIDWFELAQMTVDVTGGDIFYGANMVRSTVHHCHLIQRTAGNAIMNVSPATGLGTTYLAENDFHHNREYVYGATRTIEAWHLDMTGTANANDNAWRRCVIANQDHDTAKYHFLLRGGSGTTADSRANEFAKLCFEYPTGGMFRLEGVTDTIIDRCTLEDLAAFAVTASPLISLGVTGGGAATTNTRIRDYMRRGGDNVSLDIGADSSSVGAVSLENITQIAGGAALAINLNGAPHSLRGIGGSGTSGLGSSSGVAVRSLQAEGLAGSVQSLSNGSTVTIANPVVRVSNSGAVTGIILTAGQVGGQQVTVINQSAGSVTFDASGTSHVASGASCVIAGDTAKRFVWNSGQSLWYAVGG